MYVFGLDMPLIEIIVVIFILLVVFALSMIFCFLRIRHLEQEEIKKLNELEKLVGPRNFNEFNVKKTDLMDLKERQGKLTDLNLGAEKKPAKLEENIQQISPRIKKAREFVLDAKSKGYSEDRLRDAFEKKGWSEGDIDMIFQLL